MTPVAGVGGGDVGSRDGGGGGSGWARERGGRERERGTAGGRGKGVEGAGSARGSSRTKKIARSHHPDPNP